MGDKTSWVDMFVCEHKQVNGSNHHLEGNGQFVYWIAL